VPGTLRQRIVVDGRHRLTTDEPPSVGGHGTAPAPHELLPAALASCIGTTLAMYTRTKGWEPGEITVDVRYDKEPSPRTFDIVIELTGDLSEAQLQRLATVAETCPLRRALETGFSFSETLRRSSEFAYS
jgi:putative redox protein